MTAQKILGFVLLLVFALLAAMFVKVALTPVSAPVQPQILSTTQDVVVAEETSRQKVLLSRADLSAGRFIDAGDLTWAELDVAGYHWISSDDYRLDDFTGGVLIEDIKAGEAIPYQAIVRPQQQGFLAAVLSPGTRAVSVPVNEITASAGLIGPGDYIDVLLTLYADSDRGAWSMSQGGDINMLTSKTLASGVRVIAINRRSLANPDQELGKLLTTATLEVAPELAQKLALAAHMGSLSLNLRAQRDPGFATEQSEVWSRDVHSVSDQMKPHPGMVLMRGVKTQVVGFNQKDENTNDEQDSES